MLTRFVITSIAWALLTVAPVTSPGMDCDDGDETVFPGNGC